jgi:PAS domain S-box-containing protein
MADTDASALKLQASQVREMSALVQATDWSQTPLGPMADWSPSLRQVVDLLLASGFPMALRWGPDFILIYNDGYRPILGEKHPWALGRPAREAWSEVWAQIEPLHRQILNGESDAVFTPDVLLRIRRYQDKWEDAHFTLSYSPTPDDTAPGGIGGVFVTAVEITEQIAASVQLREAQDALVAANRALEAERAFLRDLFQKAPSFMAVIHGPDHRFELANIAYEQLIGHRNVVGKAIRDVLPELAEQGTIEVLDRVYATGEAFSGRRLPANLQRTAGGPMEQRYVDVVYQPIRDPGNMVRGIFVDGFDITERVVAEQALQRLNDTLEHQIAERTRERDRLWRNSQDLLAVIDEAGILRATNPAWTDILGWRAEEVVGRVHLDFIHPEDRASSQMALERALRRELPSVECRCLHKDGGWRWIAWVASSEDDLVYASGRHITAEKQAEADLAAAQSALRQSQKMEAIGQLTGGIAHDFNNMLAIVIGSLELAGRKLQRGEADVAKNLENAHEGAARAATLTRRLLAFSRQSPLAPTVLIAGALVASMSDLLRRTLGDHIALATVLADDLWPAHVDANQLESAIVNLAVNARDAMPEGGRLTVETGNAAFDDRDASIDRSIPAGHYVMIAISDDGHGMAADILDKVFDPFFTTKPVGQGTGLGLSMVYGFAQQSGGHVRIVSEVGRGTTVRLYLPRHQGPIDEVNGEMRPVAVPTAASPIETVLVVEDEEKVREMSVEALRELGYVVHAAGSGEEAIRLFDTLSRVDIVFTDIMMAGMNGRQMADVLRARQPGLKILYTTGYARDAIIHGDLPDAGISVLSKPFSVGDLAIRVRAVLDGDG